MKLMKIFGMVFALHVALACVLVLIQGCRSTPARAPEAPPVTAAPVTEPEPGNWSSQSSSLAPLPVDASAGAAAPVSAAPLTGLSPAERARTAPTRPSNPDAYISTSTPTALAPPPPEPTNYVVRSGDSLWKIARAHKVTTAEIQRLNPSVRADSLRPGMTIKVPGAAPANAASSFTPSGGAVTSTASSATYVVRSGDSLSKIAARNGTTVAVLREANNLRSDVLQIGQELQIPGGTAAAPTGASSVFTPGEAPLPPPGSTTRTGGEAAGQVTVVLQRGDTLGAIARRFDVTVRDLMAANNITDATRVRVGQKLVIPGFHAVGTGTLPSTSAPASRAPASSTATPPSTTPSAPTTPAPSALPPPVVERPTEFDAPPATDEAPPVQPIEGEPVPAP